MYNEDEVDKKIRRLRETTKYSPALIGRQVRLTNWEVKVRLRRMGLPDDRRPHHDICWEALKAGLIEGKKYRELSKQFGISPPAISFHAKKWGLIRRQFVPLDDELIITKYLADLWSPYKIAKEYNYCSVTVTERLKFLGVFQSKKERYHTRAEKRWRDNGSPYPLASGYPLMRIPEGHIGRTKKKAGYFTFAHIIKMEQKLGRPLTKRECIHHIDMDKTNMDFENLYLCEDARAHALIHGTMEKCVSVFVKAGIVKFKPGYGYYLKKRPKDEDMIELPEPSIPEPKPCIEEEKSGE